MKMSSDQKKNMSSAIKRIREACKKKAKVICLPELFLSNYFCQQEKHSNFDVDFEDENLSIERKRFRLSLRCKSQKTVPLFSNLKAYKSLKKPPTPIEIDSGPIPGPLRQLLPDSLKTYGDGNPQITVTQKEETPALVLRPDPGGGWATDFALDASFALGPFSAQITPESLSLNDSFTPDTLSITTASIDMVRGLDLPRQITGHLETGHLDIILPLLLSDPSSSCLLWAPLCEIMPLLVVQLILVLPKSLLIWYQ